MDIKEKALRIALNTFLSDFNVDADPEEIHEAISDAESWSDLPGVSVWEPFENHTPSDVAGYIANLARDIEEGFKG